MSSIVDDLLSRHKIISDQIEPDELRVLLGELESVLRKNIPGDIVEFGCYIGTTSLFISRLMRHYRSGKSFYVYDSFDGLPEKTSRDASPLGVDFKRGELRATKADFIRAYRKESLPLPVITKKWFHEVNANEVPHKICFAFLDGDYYKSIRASLALVTPKMSPGGRILIDDYDNPALPGAQKAMVDYGIAPKTIQSSLAICTF